MTNDDQLYASCASGLESLLAAELKGLGIPHVQTAGSGVRFGGGLTAGYRACLWSSVANRILLPLHSGAAATPEALYDRVREVDWSEHMDVDGSLAVDFFTSHSEITHSQYGALKAKDAVVDQFRECFGRRPNVDRDTPSIRINLYLYRNKVRIALDLSGSSLHRRGYREATGPAPLKENLAAALLLAADWPARCEAGEAFADPLCGSGTLLVEAAMMARHIAPGLGRDYFGFLDWKQHEPEVWATLRDEAEQSIRRLPVPMFGSDSDAHTVELAGRNLELAGVSDEVHLSCRAIGQGVAPAPIKSGLVVTNPPYGARLAADDAFYAELGQAMNRDFAGWDVGVIVAQDAQFRKARLPLKPILQVRNGGLDCDFLLGRIPSLNERDSVPGAGRSPEYATERDVDTSRDTAAAVSPWANAIAASNASESSDQEGSQAAHSVWSNALHVDIEPFANRVKKNKRSLKGWLRSEGINAWRVYDADLPEFSVAIDVFDAGQRHCVIQEYQAPPTINTAMASARLEAIVKAVPELLGVKSEHVHVKVRERQSGDSQYQKSAAGNSVTEMIEELDCRFELNFSDYLDTGLFLDHRKVRRDIQKQASGKRFLNLFAYTASATVQAAIGGADSSVSVDLSNRYCSWALRNLRHNHIDTSRHEVVKSDVIEWLEAANRQQPFDLILLDPPTFSNSSDVKDWNIQNDHVSAIDACLELLADDGLLIFSNNFRKFKLDAELASGRGGQLKVEDRSRWSIDRDFQRNPRIHQCWYIRQNKES